jgi:hypothetical protein
VLNGELRRKWEEALVAYYKELPQHLRRGTDENHEYNRKGRDSDQGVPEFETSTNHFCIRCEGLLPSCRYLPVRLAVRQNKTAFNQTVTNQSAFREFGYDCEHWVLGRWLFMYLITGVKWSQYAHVIETGHVKNRWVLCTTHGRLSAVAPDPLDWSPHPTALLRNYVPLCTATGTALRLEFKCSVARYGIRTAKPRFHRPKNGNVTLQTFPSTLRFSLVLYLQRLTEFDRFTLSS